MKKTKYVRPLAEVIELDAQDIITASDELTPSLGGEAHYIPAGNISDYTGSDTRVKLGN